MPRNKEQEKIRLGSRMPDAELTDVFRPAAAQVERRVELGARVFRAAPSSSAILQRDPGGSDEHDLRK